MKIKQKNPYPFQSFMIVGFVLHGTETRLENS